MDKSQVISMLFLQDSLNKLINPNWISAGYPWHRAAMHEAVELQEHIGWKWWKHQHPNLAQAKMELIDIWHFYLSSRLVRFEGDFGYAADNILAQRGLDDYNHVPLLEQIDKFVECCAYGVIHGALFDAISRHVGLTDDELMKTYIGKNVLNIFRQQNGYKQGTYIKVWAGREDNEFVSEFLEKNPPDAAALMKYLDETYAANLAL